MKGFPLKQPEPPTFKPPNPCYLFFFSPLTKTFLKCTSETQVLEWQTAKTGEMMNAPWRPSGYFSQGIFHPLWLLKKNFPNFLGSPSTLFIISFSDGRCGDSNFHPPFVQPAGDIDNETFTPQIAMNGEKNVSGYKFPLCQ